MPLLPQVFPRFCEPLDRLIEGMGIPLYVLAAITGNRRSRDSGGMCSKTSSEKM